MGADYIQNIITDRISSPPDTAHLYTEHLVYMPHAYLINSLRESFPHLVPPRYIRAAAGSGDDMHRDTRRGEEEVLREEEQQVREFVGASRLQWGLPQDAVLCVCVSVCLSVLIQAPKPKPSPPSPTSRL